MHLTPLCKEELAFQFCNSQTRDQRRCARHGAGRKTTGKARREENEALGENSVNGSGQPSFVLLEPEKEHRVAVIPDKVTWQQLAGWAGKGFPLPPTAMD